MTIERGTALVHQWKSRFGFGHYRFSVQPLPAGTAAWAQSFFEINEEWAVIELPPDDFFPPKTLEMLVLHELSHGLLRVAGTSENGEEVACNRIARMAKSDWKSPLFNEHHAEVVGDAWFEDEDSTKSSAGALDRHKWLPLIADALPEKERLVIALMYWGELSYRQTASVMGVDIHTVARWRETALNRLREYYSAAENEFG